MPMFTHNENDNHGFEFKGNTEHIYPLDTFKLDFEPDDEDLNSGDETDQTTLLD